MVAPVPTVGGATRATPMGSIAAAATSSARCNAAWRDTVSQREVTCA
ncbi:MAG: hypothetical protein IPF47_19705 [Gemmatimonadetes bacterium]|nr:hypothetical protein [Gemmatimonadota bacterium]MBK9976750.1 hypothetical protein [Gemmatimonadota bacterium]